MKIYEGFKNISVKLLNFPVDLPEKHTILVDFLLSPLNLEQTEMENR